MRVVTSTYVRALGVDVSDAVKPPDGFRSFDDFFTRQLVPNARPIDVAPNAIVSPCDGRIEAAGRIRADGSFQIKGSAYTAVELLGSQSLAEAYVGGHFVVIYLSPRDYHRVHAPDNGAVVSVTRIAGALNPVNAWGVKAVPGLFAKNQRVCVVQRSSNHGNLAVVMVGALGVGRISLSFTVPDSDPDPSPNRGRTTDQSKVSSTKTNGHHRGALPQLARGQELGIFHLGSTVVLCLERQPTLQFVRQVGDTLRMGETLARREVDHVSRTGSSFES